MWRGPHTALAVLLLLAACSVVVMMRGLEPPTTTVLGHPLLRPHFTDIESVPAWTPPTRTDGPAPIDLFFTCPPDRCHQHATTAPPSYWEQLRQHGFRVVYVVAGARVGFAATRQQLVAHVPRVKELPIAVLATDTAAEEYPPIHKEMDLLRVWAAADSADALFVHVDTDAVLVPARVAPLLRQIDATASDVYLGRPISSCECNEREKLCTFERATQACSGFFYITTRATLQRVPSDRFQPAPNGTGLCKSSDYSVGVLMHTLGLRCSAVRDATKPVAHRYPGMTWPLNRRGKRYTVRLPVCQQIGSPGGVHVSRTVTVPWWLDQHHRDECAVFHPAKRPHDVQYVWNLLHRGGDLPAPADTAPERVAQVPCSLAAVVMVRPSRFDRRDVVRATWGRTAKAYGVRVLFVVGKEPPEREWATLSHMLEHEQATHGDMLLSPHPEGYAELPLKRSAAMSLSSPLQCNYFAKVDVDTYFRPYQALKMMETLELQHEHVARRTAADSGTGTSTSSARSIASAAGSGVELFVGHIWDARKSGKPNVVHDPTHPWYVGYEGDFYPPFASGYASVFSASLWRRVAKCLETRVRLGPEDVQAGLCVHAVKTAATVIVHAKEMDYDSPCTEATVADNAVCSATAFNLIQRHEADARGKFCSLGSRKFRVGDRNYGLDVDAFSAGVVSSDAGSHFLAVATAPWEVLGTSGTPDVFAFVDPRAVELEDFHANSDHGAALQRALAKVAPAKGERVWAYQCVGCLGSWHLAVHVTANGAEARRSQAIAVGPGLTSQFGFTRAARRTFDVGVAASDCGPALMQWLGHVAGVCLRDGWDIRVVVDTVECGAVAASHGADFTAWLTGAVAAAATLPRDRVAVVGKPGGPGTSEQHLHDAARDGATLLVLRPGVTVAPGLFVHADAFVVPGACAYFPVVLSQYEASQVALARRFYGRHDVSRSLQGAWRDSIGHLYAIAGVDARRLSSELDRQGAQAGARTSPFVALKQHLHVIRMREPGLQAPYSAVSDCVAQARGSVQRLRQCVGSAGAYFGSSLGMFLEHELPRVGLTSVDEVAAMAT